MCSDIKPTFLLASWFSLEKEFLHVWGAVWQSGLKKSKAWPAFWRLKWTPLTFWRVGLSVCGTAWAYDSLSYVAKRRFQLFSLYHIYQNDNLKEISHRVHTEITQVDFLSWGMLFTLDNKKMHSGEKWRNTFLGEPLNAADFSPSPWRSLPKPLRGLGLGEKSARRP